MVHSADKGFKCEVRSTRHRMVHIAAKEFKCEVRFWQDIEWCKVPIRGLNVR